MSRRGSYDWITDAMFDAKLEELVGKMTQEAILATPGVREILAEELNNEVLEELASEREEEDDDD